MIKRLVESVFGSRQEREVKRLQPTLAAIHAQEDRLKELADEVIQAQTAKFRGILTERTGELEAEVERIRREKQDSSDPDEREKLEVQLGKAEHAWKEAIAQTLDDLLPEAYATVREASRRLLNTEFEVMGQPMVWNMVPYDVQLIGGINLHAGRIAEMATGEGKTLVATLPLYLNALPGRGAHLVTVNDYLARRDSQWMGCLFKWLGLTVACLDDTEPSSLQRQEAYRADITYGTNNEFGFDYLRDNMVFTLEQRVQREHVYALIDEVDSILIDEARTPLIISGPAGIEDNSSYREYNAQVADLVRHQNEVVSELVAEGEKLLADEKKQFEASVALYQAHLGGPRNKKLMKLMQESGVQQMVMKAELAHIADRKLPARQQTMRAIEDSLYYVLDEKGHSVHLTDRGAQTLAPNNPGLFVVPDISVEIHAIEHDPDLDAATKATRRNELEAAYAAQSEKLHIIHKLLQAHALYERETEYIVQDGQVLIVDEGTGRIMHGRRWSDGLHQAVEAKEGVTVKGETQTFATITIQNYFRMYEKLSGMTGTAETEETEFFTIYGLDVAIIPTNKPIRRDDLSDRIYRSRREKFNAVAAEVERVHRMGWPILIGTTSVEISETLSRQFKRAGLPHEVLNAKHHQREAEIVAKAGHRGAITIATNMAGRGTDIKLDPSMDLSLPEAGLHIVGTERHESRRVDRQLRGRSGRQGDPGQSLFFLSLEDDLMRLFASERVARLMGDSDEGEVITGKLVTSAVEIAQKRVELQNFQQRKRLLEYDDVMNQQREVVYSTRLFALHRGEETAAEALKMVRAAARTVVDRSLGGVERAEEFDRVGLQQSLMRQFLLDVPDLLDGSVTRNLDAIHDAVQQAAEAAFQRKIGYLQEFGSRIGITDVHRQVISQLMLGVIDEKWKDHLYDMDQLRNSIQYRAYGQKDPLIEYKKEAFEMFEDLLSDIQITYADRFLKVQVSAEGAPPPPPPPPQGTLTGPGGPVARPQMNPATSPEPIAAEAAVPAGAADDMFAGPAPHGPAPQVTTSQGRLARQQSFANEGSIGRNDPCPCGSGKKYKKCHGRNA